MLASAIVEILEGEPGLSVYAVARTGADAVLLATRERFRVALMDYRLPDMNGAEAANLIRKVTPLYPPVAKSARIQGTVRFTATIAKDGTIQNLQLVAGQPVLVPAATEAVRQWVYRPTLLNGEPVEVITQIEVNFDLNQ